MIDVAAAWRVNARHRASIGICLNTGAVVGDHHNNAGLVIPASHRLLLLASQRISKPPAQCVPHVITLHKYRSPIMGLIATFFGLIRILFPVLQACSHSRPSASIIPSLGLNNAELQQSETV